MLIYAPFFRAYERTVLREPMAQDRLLETAEAIREHELELARHHAHAAAGEHAPKAGGGAHPPS